MRPTRIPLVLTAVLLAGCAGGSTGLPQPGVARGVPGFDTWQYPGDALMASWRSESPYQWVGYYLESPCHRDASWMGRRQQLESEGWGIALLYVGQQVFEGQSVDNSGVEEVLCSRTLLTTEQGIADARDAIATARAEGFPPGTVIFLDIERVSRIPPEMLDYLGAWIDVMLDDGSYRPGLYAHRANASGLYFTVSQAYSERGSSLGPPVWIAGGTGFTLDSHPEEAGLTFATVWQGVLDVQRTWAGRSLRIDENVAEVRSPSAP